MLCHPLVHSLVTPTDKDDAIECGVTPGCRLGKWLSRGRRKDDGGLRIQRSGRRGIASGPTLPQSGDYYGRAVNLASRLTAVARPGSVLVDAAAKEAAGDDFSYSFAGERKLKGIDSGVKLFRARREPKQR